MVSVSTASEDLHSDAYIPDHTIPVLQTYVEKVKEEKRAVVETLITV